MLFGKIRFPRTDCHAVRHQQRLRADFGFVPAGFQALVGDALVGGVHVHQHQTVAILRQDVDAVQLRQRETQRRDFAFHLGGKHGIRRCRITICGLQRNGIDIRTGWMQSTVQLHVFAHLPGWRGRLRRQMQAGLLAEFACFRTTDRCGGRQRQGLRFCVGGREFGNGAVQRAKQEIMHLAAFAEAHFVFGGMHVHVHPLRVQFQVQHIGGETAVVHHVLVGLAHGVVHHLVAHTAAVDEEMLQVGLAAGKSGQTEPAPQPQALSLGVDADGTFNKAGAAQGCDTTILLHFIQRRLQRVHDFLVVAQGEADSEMAQGQAFHHVFQMAEFGLVGAQEFASRRRIEKQVAHFHRGALVVGGGHDHGVHVAAFGLHFPAGATAIGAGGECKARDGTDAGEGLTAKAEGCNAFEIFKIADLAGRVAGDGERQVVLFDAAAVVADADQLDATLFHVDVEPGGAGVQAVFQQLFHHRGGTFDNFPRRDLVGQARSQAIDVGQDGNLFVQELGMRNTWPTRTVAGSLRALYRIRLVRLIW